MARRSPAEAAVAAVASRNHGLFTRHEAFELGMTRHQIEHGLECGTWHEVHRGVYRFTAAPFTWHTNVLAACRAGRALASHRTAAVLWELDGFRPGRVEVTHPRGTFFRPAGVRSHESLDLHLASPVRRYGIPATGIGRTLLDLGAVVSLDVVEHAVDDAVRRKLVSVEEGWRVLVAHARRGRRGVAKFRQVLESRTPLGATDSWFERLFVERLLAANLPQPTLQHEVHDADGFVGRLDLAWPRFRVGVELDGKAFHLSAAAFERDAEKRNRLRLGDWLVLVVTWKMFTERPWAVWGDIAAALRARGANLGGSFAA